MELNNIKDLENFLNQNKIFDIIGIDRVGVFGSFARGEKSNDIDLLFDRVSDKLKTISIIEDLEKKTGKKFDIVFNELANPIILYRAKKDIVYVEKYKE